MKLRYEEISTYCATLSKVVKEKENNPYTTETSGYLQEPRTSPDTNPFDW